MLNIHHQGWNEITGVYQCDVSLDESREDHEIQFPNGVTYHQATPFFLYKLDWNQTGEPFGRLGAFFEHGGTREFFTPLELISLALDHRGYIPGLCVKHRQEPLSDRIQSATRRSEALNSLQKPATPDLNSPIQNL